MVVSPRTVYSDFETRASWQPGLQSVAQPEEVQLKVANRCDWIYRQASISVHSSSNESVKLGALNTMLKANSALSDAWSCMMWCAGLRSWRRKLLKECLCREALATGTQSERVG